MFSPSSGSTQTVAVGATSASVSIDPQDTVLQLLNVGTAVVFIRMGRGAQTATVTDYPVLNGAVTEIAAFSGADTVAVISAAGGETLYVTTGNNV